MHKVDSRGTTHGPPDDGDAALGALSDSHLVRGLVKGAELVAVKTARWQGKVVADRRGSEPPIGNS
jgi:hypothetical protein